MRSMAGVISWGTYVDEEPCRDKSPTNSPEAFEPDLFRMSAEALLLPCNSNIGNVQHMQPADCLCNP